MSGNFTARRAPNVSQYLANLNTIPSAQEVSAQNDFNLGDDGLDFLTNAEFFDFDNFNGDVGAFQQAAAAPPQDMSQKPAASAGVAVNNIAGPQYQFGEFQTYPAMTASPSTMPPSPANGLQGAYPSQPPHHFPQANTGDKRKVSAAGMPSAADLEEVSRMAAEEDKRRRNTAASARFRVKKKQREQALEKQTKEMSDKMAALEGKVQQLEMENKWLKGLITEKGSVEMPIEKKEAEKKGGESSTESRTDGVGTDEKAEAEEV